MHDEPGPAIKADGGSREIAQTPALRPLGTVYLSAAHNLSGFTSRSTRIQGFIQNEVQEYLAKRYCSVCVWPHPDDPSRILGFYTLAACSIEREELNNRFSRKNKTIGGIAVPMALVGYMGKSVDAPKGFGGTLILDAAIRAARSEDIPVWGLALHPENDSLAKWYGTLGFTVGEAWRIDNKRRRVMYAPLKALMPAE